MRTCRQKLHFTINLKDLHVRTEVQNYMSWTSNFNAYDVIRSQTLWRVSSYVKLSVSKHLSLSVAPSEE